MPPDLNSSLPAHFPIPPTTSSPMGLTYPRDLLADGREFYTQISFVDYTSTINSGSGAGVPVGGVILPIPIKLNDVQTVIWQESSLMAQAANFASLATLANTRAGRWSRALFTGGALTKDAISAFTGLQMNPYFWMLFSTPAFKSHILTWYLVANNEQETRDIANIGHYFKRNCLPSGGGLNPLYAYPSIAMIKIFPDDFFTMRFKPCAVEAVDIDLTGGGVPSFFRNGAPTVVRFSLVLKEITLWTKDNYWT